MLIIWTGAQAHKLRSVVGSVLGQYHVEHRVESDMDSFPQATVGDVVLACGTKALEKLVEFGIVPKNRTVSSLRSKEMKYHGVSLVLTYDPGICSRDYTKVPELQWDMALAIRITTTGSSRPVLGSYRWVESFHETIEEIERKYEKTKKPVRVACDTETLGLVEYADNVRVISISFSHTEGFSDAMYFEFGEAPEAPAPFLDYEEMTYWQGVWAQIHWLLTSPKVKIVGANWKYDSRWIRHKWGIECTNHKFDTLLVGSLLEENRSNSLKLHAKIMTSLGGYEDPMAKYDMGRLDLVPKDELIDYMGGDTDATLRVANVMEPQLLADRRLCNFYVKLQHPASHAFEKLERTGVCVDLPYYRELGREVSAEVKTLRYSMLEHLPHKLRIKWKDKINDQLAEDKSPLVPSILKDFLFSPMGLNLKPKMLTAKTKEPSTSIDHLMMFADNPDAQRFIKLLDDHNSAAKTYSTFIVGFLKHLRSDGRFHPTYLLSRMDYEGDDSGTVTGRCLTEEARILTDKGEISIKELVERGEHGEAFKVLTHKNRWLPVTGFWRNGLKPVCTVKAQGHSLTSTYNHPFMSFPSWTLAGDLKVGSWLYSVIEPPKVEEWRQIKDWPFEVSNMGRVRRAIDGNGVVAGQVVPSRPKGTWGHRMVSLTKFDHGREKIDVPVHKLVADAFLTNNGGVEISHLNGDASCNWSTNLKWVSVEDNKLYFRLHGSANKDNQKKLDWAKVDDIRAGMFGNDYQASSALGVSRELVRDVRLWKKWNGRREPMTGFAPIRVDSVTAAGVQETFDLTVEDDHSFIANGLVVHNTAAKEPAIQCQRGSSLICCKDGRHTIKSIVEGFESGRDYWVKSHTGSWRRVVDVYRNGVKPVFEVTTRSGLVTGCTENHPLLLDEGFVRTDATKVGDLVFVDRGWHGTESKARFDGAEVLPPVGRREGERTSGALVVSVRLRNGKVHSKSGTAGRTSKILRLLEKGKINHPWARGKGRVAHLHLMGGNAAESTRYYGSSRGLEELRGSHSRSKMGVLRELSLGHGGAASGHNVGPQGKLQRVLQGKLSLGNSITASTQPDEQRHAYIQWSDAMRSRMGRYYRAGDELVLPATSRLDRGRGFVDSQRAAQAGFVLDPIVSIRYVGDEETFDLTVEEDHSFVSDGFVVHNTYPKHTKWAKKLRRAIIAPPGYIIIQLDYSQGELRIAAVVANEPTMIAAYLKGIDLHAVTAAALNGYELEEFMLLPEDVRDELRSGGKAGNFGLLYGMQAPGFKAYAFNSYGVVMTDEESVQKREAFFGRFDRLLPWHSEAIEFAKMHQYVRSPLGRVRHLPMIASSDREIVSQAQRQAINSPIQSCLSDMMQLAMVHIDRQYGAYDIHPFMMTHDSLALYVPEQEGVEWARRLKIVMENLPLKEDFGWDSPLKFMVDAEMAIAGEDGVPHLAGLKKLKGL